MERENESRGNSPGKHYTFCNKTSRFKSLNDIWHRYSLVSEVMGRPEEVDFGTVAPLEPAIHVATGINTRLKKRTTLPAVLTGRPPTPEPMRKHKHMRYPEQHAHRPSYPDYASLLSGKFTAKDCAYKLVNLVECFWMTVEGTTSMHFGMIVPGTPQRLHGGVTASTLRLSPQRCARSITNARNLGHACCGC